jgi:hypothetical protein
LDAGDLGASIGAEESTGIEEEGWSPGLQRDKNNCEFVSAVVNAWIRSSVVW